MSTPEAVRGSRAWHGPASVVAVTVGLLVEAVPLLVRADGLWVLFLLPPLVGLLMLAAPATRQVGTGLLAAGLAYPFALVALGVVALLA